MNDELPPQHGPSGFLIAVTIVGAFAIGFALLFKSALTPPDSPQMGLQFPPIEVVGWLNGSGPTAEDLRGQVFVVDAWAYWCGPCRMATPYIMALHEKYQDRGVKFIGLTSEGLDSDSIRQSRQYVEGEKIPWPNGYGAVKTLGALNVDVIPQFWIVDRQNQIVFHERGFSEDSIPKMERAIIQALGTGTSKTGKPGK